MPFTINCPYCGKEIVLAGINPGQVKGIHRWNGTPLEDETAEFYQWTVVFLALFSLLAFFTVFLSLVVGVTLLAIFLIPLLVLLWKYDVDGVSLCPFCGKRFHIVGGTAGTEYTSKMPETVTTIPKRILEVLRRNRGVATLSTMFEKTEFALEKIKESLTYLQNEGLIKKISKYYTLPEKIGKDERDVILLAKKADGELSLKKIIKDLKWESARVKATLKELEEKGMTLRKDQPGKVLWYFPGLTEKSKEE